MISIATLQRSDIFSFLSHIHVWNISFYIWILMNLGILDHWFLLPSLHSFLQFFLCIYSYQSDRMLRALASVSHPAIVCKNICNGIPPRETSYLRPHRFRTQMCVGGFVLLGTGPCTCCISPDLYPVVYRFTLFEIETLHRE